MSDRRRGNGDDDRWTFGTSVHSSNPILAGAVFALVGLFFLGMSALFALEGEGEMALAMAGSGVLFVGIGVGVALLL